MNKEIKIGSKWNDSRGRSRGASPFKVMGIVEKWVVMRRKGATPCLRHINDLGIGKELEEVVIDWSEGSCAIAEQEGLGLCRIANMAKDKDNE